MVSIIVSYSSLLLLSTAVAYVIPNNDFIRLPLTRHTHLTKRAGSEGYKLYNADRTEYLTKIYIGTPPQEFQVSVDTGSADTWVPWSSCASNECPYARFDSSKSSTFQSMNLSFALTYGQGSIHGEYAKDKISLSPTSKLSISQTFGLTKSAKDIITQGVKMTSNGILGLGFPALTANSDTVEAYNPFVFQLAQENMISNPVFCISLNIGDGWSSELTIGGVDETRYKGEISYVPVEKNTNPKTQELDYTFWSVQLESIGVENGTKEQVKSNVILDTGTTLSYLTKTLVDRIVSDVTQEKLTFDLQNELYLVKCELKTSHKKILLDFKGAQLSIDLADLILPFDDQHCAFGITYNFDKKNSLVLGDSLLRSAFFVFDLGQKRVGMATAVNSESKVIAL
ncbi:aspartic peptidase domain-containing protein [Mucor mucedo]|uniref:aspartic peptidase domain-containing protein n=1 Tax=Mucor mucedo TaxID=29922 RepID=UPI0022202A96|nr:aspartic peptidase domain-containing protein [Mucor mucedo]KAI7897321.1 aspartic peptidase domain-containing protein [Mucor mucedo]